MLVTFKTDKLAKEKGFQNISKVVKSIQSEYVDYKGDGIGEYYYQDEIIEEHVTPTQSELQKFIREKRGVHIEIHRNASGYYWSMCKSDGGTDLGWSAEVGPNDSGVWGEFEEALEHALQVQLSFDLPDNTSVIKHWGNYVGTALGKLEKI